ncbi:hypothetical protein VOLCADRAFT_118779 [Volvox carteri f. nagariensis]|uniref:FCP1 homology domain-containing protein n=1 Tax=Volvox carteri f. nagariensis TaxID=3068 RepID=D8U7D2_VOLCA|nr:uncharacterized protein VOLCADRAFT_118779 [Volvox carteri f. nagariensis]EFJ44401.1 hypothetical protein VOLCADRAFT_118779 [Volvox carteri f. nagariensis]|eukprot:XP_002954508.1 hypothetical protein VOLCADRAFT_118779 [Volvox carteri f. nagariensis]
MWHCCRGVQVSGCNGQLALSIWPRPHFRAFLETVRRLFRLTLWSSCDRTWTEAALLALDPCQQLLPRRLLSPGTHPEGALAAALSGGGDGAINQLASVIIICQDRRSFDALSGNAIEVEPYTASYGRHYDDVLLRVAALLVRHLADDGPAPSSSTPRSCTPSVPEELRRLGLHAVRMSSCLYSNMMPTVAVNVRHMFFPAVEAAPLELPEDCGRGGCVPAQQQQHQQHQQHYHPDHYRQQQQQQQEEEEEPDHMDCFQHLQFLDLDLDLGQLPSNECSCCSSNGGEGGAEPHASSGSETRIGHYNLSTAPTAAQQQQQLVPKLTLVGCSQAPQDGAGGSYLLSDDISIASPPPTLGSSSSSSSLGLSCGSGDVMYGTSHLTSTTAISIPNIEGLPKILAITATTATTAVASTAGPTCGAGYSAEAATAAASALATPAPLSPGSPSPPSPHPLTASDRPLEAVCPPSSPCQVHHSARGVMVGPSGGQIPVYQRRGDLQLGGNTGRTGQPWGADGGSNWWPFQCKVLKGATSTSTAVSGGVEPRAISLVAAAAAALQPPLPPEQQQARDGPVKGASTPASLKRITRRLLRPLIQVHHSFRRTRRGKQVPECSSNGAGAAAAVSASEREPPQFESPVADAGPPARCPSSPASASACTSRNGISPSSPSTSSGSSGAVPPCSCSSVDAPFTSRTQCRIAVLCCSPSEGLVSRLAVGAVAGAEADIDAASAAAGAAIATTATDGAGAAGDGLPSMPHTPRGRTMSRPLS